MSRSATPLPGTSDIWEPEVADWVFLEDTARNIFSRYGYGELRIPIFERTNVFIRSIGDETDVVQKEMYTFEDRGGRSLTLRPEGTAGVIRAIANKGLSQGHEERVFYTGPMFRGERPAAGRKRQFHQIGVEAVGKCDPLADVECMAMLLQYLDRIGVYGGELLLNTRGLPEDRETVSGELHAFFSPHVREMCDDCRRRLDTNIWRILDCKNPKCQGIVSSAPRMTDLLGSKSKDFFAEVCCGLDALNIPYTIDPRLVRGLDYYIHTVFEVTHPKLGAQDAVAGGGRYRITLPGGKPLDGTGFAAGLERLLMARSDAETGEQTAYGLDVYVVGLNTEATVAGLELAQALREDERPVRVRADLTGRSMKAQMRTANRLGSRLTLILGGNELKAGTVTLKNMATSEQGSVPMSEICRTVHQCLRDFPDAAGKNDRNDR